VKEGGGRRKGGERGWITRARHWSEHLRMAVRFRKRPMGLMMASTCCGSRARPPPAPVPAETDATISISLVLELTYRKALHFPTTSQSMTYCTFYRFPGFWRRGGRGHTNIGHCCSVCTSRNAGNITKQGRGFDAFQGERKMQLALQILMLATCLLIFIVIHSCEVGGFIPPSVWHLLKPKNS
jgi:hypothetical protein